MKNLRDYLSDIPVLSPERPSTVQQEGLSRPLSVTNKQGKRMFGNPMLSHTNVANAEEPPSFKPSVRSPRHVATSDENCLNLKAQLAQVLSNPQIMGYQKRSQERQKQGIRDAFTSSFNIFSTFNDQSDTS